MRLKASLVGSGQDFEGIGKRMREEWTTDRNSLKLNHE